MGVSNWGAFLAFVVTCGFGFASAQTPTPTPVESRIQIEIVHGLKKSSIRIERKETIYSMTESMTGRSPFARELDQESIDLFIKEFSALPKNVDVGGCRRNRIELRISNVGDVKDSTIEGCIHDSSKSAKDFERMLTLLEAMHL